MCKRISLPALYILTMLLSLYIAQSAGAIEYTDCTSAER